MSGGPEVSVVVEWENVLLARRERCGAMLEALGRQTRSLGRPVEVVVPYDPAEAGGDEIRALLAARLAPVPTGEPSWRLAAGPRLHYYGLKNLGAREARGSVVVFLDSDVVPEPAWLEEILRPFSDPRVAVVGGATFVDPAGIVGRAMALGWFFPPPPGGTDVRDDARHFWANNVALRRDLLLENPFPEPADGTTRGACADLAAHLRGRGVRIWRSDGARVRHPPPNGLRHFLVRAVADGRDRVLRWTRAGRRPWGLPLRGLEHYAKRTLRAFSTTVRHRRRAGLALPLVPAAWAVQAAYYGTACLGAWATCAAPGPMSRGFRI